MIGNSGTPGLLFAACYLCLQKQGSPTRLMPPLFLPLSVPSCGKGLGGLLVQPSTLPHQQWMFFLHLGAQGGAFRQEVIAVLERVKDTNKAYIFIPVRFLCWDWGWVGLRPGQGRVGSREAVRRHGSFSCESQILMPLNIDFVHSRHCKIRQVDKVDFKHISFWVQSPCF